MITRISEPYPMRPRVAQFESNKNEKLEFRWRFQAKNGEILTVSAKGRIIGLIASISMVPVNNGL